MAKPLIPFAFVLPQKFVWVAARNLSGSGNTLTAFFPFLGEDLVQARYEIAPREYVSVAFANGLINAVAIFFLVCFFGALANADFVIHALALAIVIGFATFLTTVFYPRILARQRARRIDVDLIPATRQLLIEIRSGVPLFNAMASVSDGYGEVSVTFKKLVSRINNGVPEIDALTEAAAQTPSMQFRKVLWQISNALEVGGDIGDALHAITEELTRLRIDQIRRYGEELSPWTMIYMMSSVILPSLGVTMVIVISSFMNITIPAVILWIALLYLVIFQLFFMNFVKSRRPAV